MFDRKLEFEIRFKITDSDGKVTKGVHKFNFDEEKGDIFNLSTAKLGWKWGKNGKLLRHADRMLINLAGYLRLDKDGT